MIIYRRHMNKNQTNALIWLPKNLTEVTFTCSNSMALAKEFHQLLSLSSPVPLHWHQYADELSESNNTHLQCVVLDDDTGFHLLSWFSANELTQKTSFRNWLTTIAPENWDDLLMAVSTYNVLRHTAVYSINKTLQQLKHNQPAHDSILDAVLAPTRGMLLWRQQYVDLLRMCDMGISLCDSNELIKSGILLNSPAAYRILAKVSLWNGQPYLDMVQERNPFKNIYGAPLPITKFNHPAMKLYPYLHNVMH